MKTLHFDASGAYTGYSVNKSGILEIIMNAIISFASVAGSAMTLYSVGKQVSDEMKAKNATESDTTDPK